MTRVRVVVRSPITIPAPAKLNLGLEVLGQRPDGYHEVVTILQSIDLCDALIVAPAPALSYRPPEGIDDDLVARALRALNAQGIELCASIQLQKRIPLAAGLGGGSSDAGTFLGLVQRAGVPVELVDQIARSLGSDVPFFLHAGTALARGRGTELEYLPSPSGFFVIVVPQLRLHGKTERLYAALTPDDYSDGTATLRQAARLRAGLGLDPALVRNAFRRPLHAFPEVQRVLEAFTRAGARWVWPSGAGPALFTWSPEYGEAEAIATHLRESGLEPYLVTPYRPDWESLQTALVVEPTPA